jgi:type III secretion protein L
VAVNGNIIKAAAASASVAPAKVIKAETYAATCEAAEILRTARAHAEQIRKEVDVERSQIIEAAREQGYEQGLCHWNAAMLELADAQERKAAANEPELIRLAVRMAQRIIGEELRINPEVIVGIARECLRSLGRERLLTIRVPAGDLELVRHRIVLLREAAGPNRSIEVIADATIPPGGCIVESEYSVVDARLGTQLRCMEELLLRSVKK